VKRLVMPLALALTLPALGSLGAQPGKEDAKKIQGVWVMTAFEKDGNKVPAPAEFKLKIGADKIEPVGQDDPADYKLGVAKGLGTIDIVGSKGAEKGKTVKGIYELKGDELKICMPSGPEGERPTEFTSKNGAGILYLKRDKP